MTARTFIYKKLTTHQPLTNMIGGATNPRVFGKKSMTSSIENHPYVVFKMGHDAPEHLSEDTDITRQYFQVWVHDYFSEDHVDFMRIDQVLSAVKDALMNQSSAEDKVWTIKHVETSQDFDDDTLNTIFRYHRFQIIRDDSN